MLHHFAAIRGVAPEKRKDAAEEAAEKVHLQDKLGTYCRHLSGGMTRRLGIAQAFLGSPELVLLDEPTGSMDVRSGRAVTDSLDRLMKGKTTVMISHDMKMLEKAENVVVINDGTIEAQGPRDEVVKKSGTLRRLIDSQRIGGNNEIIYQ